MQGRHVHKQGLGYGRYERARKSKYLDLPSPIYCGTCEKIGHSYKECIKGELAMERNMKYVHSHSYLTEHSRVKHESKLKTPIFVPANPRGPKYIWVPKTT
ncbi:hypothetical protein Dimus_039616 [Dionaea muscipula]